MYGLAGADSSRSAVACSGVHSFSFSFPRIHASLIVPPHTCQRWLAGLFVLTGPVGPAFARTSLRSYRLADESTIPVVNLTSKVVFALRATGECNLAFMEQLLKTTWWVWWVGGYEGGWVAPSVIGSPAVLAGLRPEFLSGVDSKCAPSGRAEREET